MKNFKTITTTIILLLMLSPSYGQMEDEDYDFKMELKKFTENITYYSDQALICYNDFSNDVLPIKDLRILKSEHNYPTLIPMEFQFLSKIGNLIIPGSGVVSDIFTGLLEKGWSARNADIEASRKKDLINGQIATYIKNLYDKDDFIESMGPFLRIGSLPSDFEDRVKVEYNKSDVHGKQEIFDDLFDMNEEIEKHPIFSLKNSSTFSMKKLFYEDYIRQFASIHNNNLLGTDGSLVGYLEFDDDFNLVTKILVPDVPAGNGLGTALNSLLPRLNKKPLDLKVIKVLYINSPYYNPAEPDKKRNLWSLTLTEADNTIATLMLTKMIANDPSINLQLGTEYKHSQKFLEKFGFKDEISGLWRIKSSLFSEFTEALPNKTKDIPKEILKMIEL
jgi:hypothetical protein